MSCLMTAQHSSVLGDWFPSVWPYLEEKEPSGGQTQKRSMKSMGAFPQGEVVPRPALVCFHKVKGFVPPRTSHHDQVKAVGSTSWEQQPGKVWDKNKPPSLKLIVSDRGSLVISCRQRHQGAGSSECKPWAPSVKRLDFSSEFGVCIWSCSNTVIILCLRTEI